MRHPILLFINLIYLDKEGFAEWISFLKVQKKTVVYTGKLILLITESRDKNSVKALQ